MAAGISLGNTSKLQRCDQRECRTCPSARTSEAARIRSKRRERAVGGQPREPDLSGSLSPTSEADDMVSIVLCATGYCMTNGRTPASVRAQEEQRVTKQV